MADRSGDSGLLETARRAVGAYDHAGISRASSPGGALRDEHSELQKPSRGHPETFDYKDSLPYETEGLEREQEVLQEIIRGLYISIESGFDEQTTVWIREVKQWLSLKFTPTKEQRISLAKLSYEMALAPGLESSVAERFASLFYVLVKRKHYLRPVEELVLDWRPIYRDLKLTVLPRDAGIDHALPMKRNPRTLIKICMFAQLYFDPREIPAMLEEFLPYFNTSFIEGAYSSVGLLNLMLPTAFATITDEKLLPQHYFPSFFHLWAIVNRSKVFDSTFIDLFSRIARDMLTVKAGTFTEFGIFTGDQVATIFTAMLRLAEIPVGQSSSVYSTVPDSLAGLGMLLERDQRKYPVAHSLARWIVMSLSPLALDKPVSVMTELEALIQSVETFFHPSNSGAWTKPLAQFVFYLADFFVMRWNREASGEMNVPPERRLNNALKKRFVACLHEVVFMGIYTKSSTAMSFYLSSLQSLALLEPSLILPGALQRIYPSMQGLVEVHRTTSSLRALQVLSPIMIREKGFRCHVTTILGLALPGIDANDLEKTQYTLQYLQAVCYNIPFHNLGGKDGSSDLAMQWITGEMERMEIEGSKFAPDYTEELTDEDEEAILRSSTTGFSEFVLSFLGRVFTLLENLPDAARARSGSPEENVMHTLPACFTPLLASLSPELYDLALNKVADWVNNHVVHQARDAMAFICNCFCKVNPQKALKRLVPSLITSIRAEIDENGAASTRNAGGEVLPRDRAFLWHVSILSMCSVHVGDAVLPYKKDLMDIGLYMQQKCRGSPTVHISNFVHHLLLNLTSVYPLDYKHYEQEILDRGLRPSDWGAFTEMEDLEIEWHQPNREELQFAFELFRAHAANGIKSIKSLLDGSSELKKETKNWSDDLTRDLNLLRLLTSGVASLFDNDGASTHPSSNRHTNGSADTSSKSSDVVMGESDQGTEDEVLAFPEYDNLRASFIYTAGYSLQKGSKVYDELHAIRGRVGTALHEVHQFLIKEKEDDVPCFTALCSAYKYWISDVGIEKTAHTLDRVTRLYAAEIQPYKMAGLRKRYPRAILLRRAYVYHLQRQRYNAHSRKPSDFDEVMLRDLALSCVSTYTDVRKLAQSALDSACKCLLGVRPMLIREILRFFEQGLKDDDLEKIKGSMHLLILGCLAKRVSQDWRFAPDVIRYYLATCDIDNLTIQKLCSSATFPIMDFARHRSPYVHFDQRVVDDLNVAVFDIASRDAIERGAAKQARRRDLMANKKRELADELVEITESAHWKTASRIAAILISLGIRFKTLVSNKLAKLLVKGSVDVHPGLRSLYAGAFTALLALLQTRVICDHSVKKYVMGGNRWPGRVVFKTDRDNPEYTKKYLASFSQPDTEYYIDHAAHFGWLTWKEEYPAMTADNHEDFQFDDLEASVRACICESLDRAWFATYFKHMLQEPRDQAADRFRPSNVAVLAITFDYVIEGRAAVSLSELKKEIELAYGDGSTKHQHRAFAEILAALLGTVYLVAKDVRNEMWDYVMPKLLKIFKDELTPENSSYWLSFIHSSFARTDPRRPWPMLKWLADFRLDMSSNAAFKESSKIQLLQECMSEVGWRFQLEKPILEDFLAHIDHPYKAVREAIGGTLATIYRSRYHESYRDVSAFVEHQRSVSPLGSRPWQPTAQFTETIRDVFARIEQWRLERPPGQTTPSSYTNGSKTVLIWLDGMLSSQECTLLQPFFADLLLEPLLHMMDIKEDQELMVLAYHVFRQIPNIPHRAGEESELITAMIRVGRTSPFWHQRLRVLVNVQVFYFRRLFLMTDDQVKSLYACVSDMLADPQLEVRMGAMTTLSGMIRCSRAALRDSLTTELIARFTKSLLKNPLPKRPKMPRLPSGLDTPGSSAAGVSTPTPEHTKLVLTRHAAVLGLGALVQAHPYTSPPPAWVPGVLTTLANKANGDPGIVGKSVKTILADFKKTRQDTWTMDLKAFTPEQVEDLEGVLWKSYFA